MIKTAPGQTAEISPESWHSSSPISKCDLLLIHSQPFLSARYVYVFSQRGSAQSDDELASKYLKKFLSTADFTASTLLWLWLIVFGNIGCLVDCLSHPEM